ncbi:hypothetical protein HZB88_05230 [archaeon]|nr:hypothetical protein [archaeon]
MKSNKKRGAVIIILIFLLLLSEQTLAATITVNSLQKIANISPLLYGNNILYWDELRNDLTNPSLINHSKHIGTSILRFNTGNSYDFRYPYEFPWDLGNTELGKDFGSITPDNFILFANSINAEKIAIIPINRTDKAFTLNKLDSGGQLTIKDKKITITRNEELVMEIDLTKFSTISALIQYINSIPNLEAGIDKSFEARANENPVYLKNYNNCPLPCTVEYEIATSERAAEFVNYMNKQDYKLKYWEIGNEPYAFMEPEEYADKVVEFSRAMKAVDPSIKIGLALCDPTICWRSEWNNITIQTSGSYVDFLVTHIYPYNITKNGADDKDSMLAFPSAYNSYGNFQYLRDVFGANSPSHNYSMPIAVTEYNFKSLIEDSKTWSELPAEKRAGNTMLNALYIADFLGVFMKNKVDAAMVFKLSDNASYGTLYTYPYSLKPVSLALYLITHNFGTTLINTSIESTAFTLTKQTGNVLPVSSEYLSAYASTNQEKIYLIVINKNQDTAISSEIILDFSPSSAQVKALTSSGIDSTAAVLSNSVLQAQSRFTHTFPAHSIALFEFSAGVQSLSPAAQEQISEETALAKTTLNETGYNLSISLPETAIIEKTGEAEESGKMSYQRENILSEIWDIIEGIIESIKDKIKTAERVINKVSS